jgi:hypothetical protein
MKNKPSDKRRRRGSAERGTAGLCGIEPCVAVHSRAMPAGQSKARHSPARLGTAASGKAQQGRRKANDY